jgi:hypothetical protein
MNVDTSLPQAPLATLPNRPAPNRTEQAASSRPVDRPHHTEPSNNKQGNQETRQAEARGNSEQPRAETRTVRQESELSQDEKRNLEQLKARDLEVRAHEAAHKNAAGNLARGNAQFAFETGPDGKRYAVGGEVSIDTSKVNGDPQATIQKAQTIRRAANAPAQPSSQDHAVAASASQLEAEARRELAEQAASERSESSSNAHSHSPRSGFSSNPTQPAPVGELLDVIV